MNLDMIVENQHAGLKLDANYREFLGLERHAEAFPSARRHVASSGQEQVKTYDCLCIGQHPKTVTTMVGTLTACGASAGGTRNISGTPHQYVMLECEIADLHNKRRLL